MNEGIAPMRVGIVGVGMISDTFIGNVKNRFRTLDLVGCTARDPGRIAAKAAQYGIAALTMDQLMDDASIDLVLNLTPVEAHAEVIGRALRAGKHVYSEKTLTADHASARALADLADEQGLALACAPDTFLGAGVQTAAAAIAAGRIGEPTGFTIMLNRGLDLLYEVMPFLQRPGAGMGYDFGVYALTSVLSILGPVSEVTGFVQTNRPHRPRLFTQGPDGEATYEIRNENVMAASLLLESGVLGSVTFNGDAVFPEQPYLCIQGTEGLLLLPNPNEFGGDVRLVRGFAHPRELFDARVQVETLPVHHGYADDSRGLGAAEMVSALREQRAPRASKEMACHMIEVLDGIVRSSRTRSHERMTSGFAIPERLQGTEVY